ncbi:hypothetical protein GPECTOR_86g371 [Gonium pectorale]|uniref:Uncharacterized protein n=1 Tax=Gonium pectorale TaxID=33097 RepID=A0A150G166_GONPE|nr:hypothetical protein GPECTOR_86g371 [Gonium pectorale]|eukprot:KXZ43578.1 hypothetical protein GPECTOR_86g371 [Gonium pectorale]
MAPASHLAARHADERWRAAAAEVARDCAKYEAYVFQAADSELLPRLDLTTQRLMAQLSKAREVAAAAAARPAATGPMGLAQRQSRDASAPAAAAGAGPGVEAALVLQLRLCRLLRRSLLRGGAGLREEGDLGGLYALRTAPSGTQQRLSRLLAAERDAVAAVRAAAAAGPRPLALPLEELRNALAEGCPEAGDVAAAAATPSREPAADTGGPVTAAPTTVGVGSSLEGAGPGPRTAAGASGAAVAAGNSSDGGSAEGDRGGTRSGGPESAHRGAEGAQGADPVTLDPLLRPLMAAAAAAGVPAAVGLPLTPPALQALLCRHPHAPLRRAVYEAGLLPRLAAALQALGEVAAVRRRTAAVLGYDSYSEYGYGGGGLAVVEGGVVMELLQELAEELRPAAEAEVLQLQRVLADREADAGARAGAGPGGQMEVGTGAEAAVSEQRTAASATGCRERGGNAGRPLAAWDVDYAAGLLQRQRGLTPELLSAASDYLSLEAVLSGLSDLLGELMGVSLVPHHGPAANGPVPEAARGSGAGTSPGSGPAGVASPRYEEGQQPQREEPGGDAARGAWGPRVVRLTVLADGRPAGVVYLDPGAGGYGTRQLRFPAGALSSQPSLPSGVAAGSGVAGVEAGETEAGEADAWSLSLPVVAVGLHSEWRGGVAGA